MKGLTQKIPAINPQKTFVCTKAFEQEKENERQDITALTMSRRENARGRRKFDVVAREIVASAGKQRQDIASTIAITNQQKCSAHVVPNDNTKEMKEHTQKIQAIDPSTKAMPKPQCSTHVEKLSRRVTFHSSVKSWDGQREQNILLERLVQEYFQKNRCVDLLSKLLRNRRQKQLSQLCTMLRALLQRLTVKTRTPLLPGGGGKGIIMTRITFRAVEQLLSLTSSVHGHCSKFGTLSGKYIL